LLCFRSIRVFACLLGVCATVPAQQYVFRAYRQADGLKNLSVKGLARDRDGFMWVATENGAYRFLGSRFEQFGREQGIAELDILAIVADPTGTVWVGTAGNLYRWDGQRFVPAGSQPIRLLGSHRIVVEDERHLLVVDGRQLYRLEHDADGRMISYLPVFSGRLRSQIPELGQVSSVSVVNPRSDGSGVWIGCGKKLYSWRDGENHAAGQPRDGAVTQWGSDKGLPEDHWEGAMQDRAGTLWAGGQDHVFALPKGASRFVNRSIPGSDPESVYGHAPLIEDREGRILAPSEEGIARWNGSSWQIFGQNNGLLHSSHVTGMAFDATGDLWLASHGDGLYNWTGYEDWAGWSGVQRLSYAAVWSIVPSRQGRVFIGTDKGSGWIDPRSGLSGPLSPASRWSFGQVGSMAADRDGFLWAGTFSGAVLRIDPRTGRTVQTARLPGVIISTIVDSAGRVFFSTEQGIYVQEAGISNAAPHRVAEVDALLGGPARIEAASAAPDGAIWFLSKNRLLRFRDGQWTAPPIDGLPGLSGSLLALSCAPDGALWVTGEQAGVWRLTLAGNHLQAGQLQLPPELRTLAPLAILADPRGWVWLGTDMGLMVWNGHTWRHLTQESGLIWNDVNQGALRMAPDGSVWVGTSGGVAHLLHPEHVFDPVSLALSVTEIRHGNDLFTGAQQITLPWGGSPLRFEISSDTTRNRSELILKIWMVGLHRDWIETSNGLALFSSLGPGDYTFKAVASNPGLNAYSRPVEVQVHILPPWWRTDWFYALCALAFLFLVVAVDRMRARALRERSRQLESQVRDRTQELEASREKLRVQATHDGMTGMFNRTAVLRALAAEMDRVRREGGTLVVALVDLDYFKRVNDTYGHLTGDEALRCFAAAVAAAIRPYDHAGRYGGEEFLLVLTQIPSQAIVQRLTSLHAAITNLQVSAGESKFKLNCSMGATVLEISDCAANVESLLTLADEALYAAKAAGRNRVVFRYACGQGADQQSPSAEASPVL